MLTSWGAECRDWAPFINKNGSSDANDPICLHCIELDNLL